MKTSIATVSLSGTLTEKLHAIADVGFDGAEIFENDLLSAQESAASIGAMMRDLGLACTMLQPFRDLEGLPGDMRQAAFDRMERKFDVMEALGTDLILLCSNCSAHAVADRSRIIADLQELGDRAAARGMRIGYEALAWGRHVNDHRDAWSIVRDVDHDAIGIVLDSFHSLVRQVPNSSIGDIRGDKVFIVQLADAPVMEMDYLNWSRHFRCFPGQGDLPVIDYAAWLERIGYDGYWSLEIFSDRFRAGSTRQIAEDGLRSLHFLKDAARREVAGEGTMAPPVKTSGIEFLEFAIGEDEAAEFEHAFTGLGFAPVARHRRKDVVRWHQNGINLVLNAEKEGFAHSYQTVHGGSVCAIGLAVAEPASALERAEGLGITRFEQAVAPDEWHIPSLRGVGGSLLYLVDAHSRDRMWSDEFPESVETAIEEGSLSTIDHVAQTMPYTEFQSWLLFYNSLLEVAATQQLEIPDPKGLVYSQAIENPDRSLRITMNGSLAQQSLSSRFLQHYFGAGVQHVAFASSDVFASAARAKDAGVGILQISPNYYDDLAARFAIDAQTLEKMRDLNILYDRDETGEYYQFYTRAIAKRLFFEVVERRDYDGYGAANAHIRINAQAQFKDTNWL